MKFVKYTMPAIAAMLMALTSCSDKGYWTEAPNDGASYSFVTNSQSYSFEDDMPESITVYVNRNNEGPAATVPVKVTSSSAEITGEATVTFEAGKAQAEYKITLGSGLECGVKHTVKIEIDDDVKAYNVSAMTISIYRSYTFSVLGPGVLTDYKFDDVYDVTIERANEINTVFRIIDPYDVGNSNIAMVITCNSDFTQATFDSFMAGFQYSGYDMGFAPAALGEIDGNDIEFLMAYRAYSGGVYQGSFGNFSQVVTMPDGWKK